MSINRHSFVAFYPSDWVGGTHRLTRLVRSVYFDVCLYNWDKNEPMPADELLMVLMDLEPGQGDQIIDVLVRSGKLQRDERGNVWSPRALVEASKSYTLWEQKSEGGRRAAEARKRAKGGAQQSSQDSSTEPSPSPDFLSEEGKASPSLSPDGDAGKPPLPRPAHPENTPEYLASVDALTGEKPKRAGAAECREVFDAWNAAAKPLGLSVAQKMTGAREGSIRARIEREGKERIAEALEALPRCRFLLGENDRGWKADLDFFVRPNSITRILEGKYRTGGGGVSAWRDMV